MGACKVELLLLAGASEGAWRPLGRSVENWECLSSSGNKPLCSGPRTGEPMKEAEKVQCGEGLEQSWEKSRGVGWEEGALVGSTVPWPAGVRVASPHLRARL